MSSVGSLIVNVGADISGIKRDAKAGAASLGSLEGATKSLGGVLKVLAVGLAARQLVSMVKGALSAVDATAKLSRQLGGTINGLQGLKLVAEEAGVSETTLAKGAENLNRRLGEVARKGAGEAAKALKSLGLDARDLSAMDLDERMATISDAMRDAGLSSQGMADVLGNLGIRQGEFVRLMMEGGDAIRAGKTAIDAMGLSLSEVDAAQIEAANDAMGRVKMASKAISQQLAVSLAPVLQVISEEMLGLAGDTDSVKGAVETVVSVAATGFGLIGNAVRGVHLVIKTLELAGWAWGTAYVEIFRGVLKALSFFVDKGIGKVNELIGAFNELPGVDITPVALTADSDFMKGLDRLSAGMRATVVAIAGDIKELATTEWPSTQADKFLAKVRETAKKAAEELVLARQTIAGEAVAGPETTEDDQKKADAAEKKRQREEEAAAAEEKALRQRLKGQLDILRDHSLSAEELENERHARSLEQLRAAQHAGLEVRGGFALLAEGLEQKHMDALASIRKKGMDKVNELSASSVASGVKQITGMLSSLTANAARENKTMFDAHKAFAIADATISGAMGVAQTIGAYPFPVNLAFAAAHAAMAAAQVGIIASKQFEGSSKTVAAPAPAVPAVGGGGGGGGGAAAGGVSGGTQQLISLNLEGDTFSRGTVLGLIDDLNEAIADGARVEVG